MRGIRPAANGAEVTELGLRKGSLLIGQVKSADRLQSAPVIHQVGVRKFPTGPPMMSLSCHPRATPGVLRNEQDEFNEDDEDNEQDENNEGDEADD